MKEIGGYFEIERFTGQEYYPGFLKFNLARTAISYFLKKVDCKKIYLPYFLCDSVVDEIKKAGIEIENYHIDNFRIIEESLPDTMEYNKWLFIVNYYGQLSNDEIIEYKKKYNNIIYDFTHAFFQVPPKNVVSVASIRKFFGVTDGAYFQADREIELPIEIDTSAHRVEYIFGRYEENASSHYKGMLQVADSYKNSYPMQMSKATQNLLKGINYDLVMDKRNINYGILEKELHQYNLLNQMNELVKPEKGPFVYPLLVKDGGLLRQKLAERKIYVPTYWKNVIEDMPKDSLEYNYASNIVALPCDHRYSEYDMDYISKVVIEIIGNDS